MSSQGVTQIKLADSNPLLLADSNTSNYNPLDQIEEEKQNYLSQSQRETNLSEEKKITGADEVLRVGSQYKAFAQVQRNLNGFSIP